MNTSEIITNIAFKEFNNVKDKHEFVSLLMKNNYLMSDINFLKYCESRTDFLTFEFFAYTFIHSKIDVYDLVHNFLDIIMDNRFLREIKLLKDEYEFLNRNDYPAHPNSSIKKRNAAILRINRFIDEIQCRL